jgi:hypothetical protein
MVSLKVETLASQASEGNHFATFRGFSLFIVGRLTVLPIGITYAGELRAAEDHIPS